MEKVTLKLGGITCPSCLQKIEGAMHQISGVQDAKVLFNASKLKATIDPSQTSAQALADAVTKLGYTVASSKTQEV
ncbi:heavy-metal-associated domain-containing protein [Schleiferilactobacillus shenzhenensis]|uniref:Cu2+-exporting ATPase n=1 Tax=Schleiferilactobacillus shenzhenensis LY-73 TaxID=1231336 RepID=U4TUE2_9LACO|nr:heavy-metal-associated domain-containing protein [Schleiferilactobacillus shenzhenensis]ERL65498.1 Cu2+-exporting ATPase [Schleiferilactobacillus shenzhenensis LY-73]